MENYCHHLEKAREAEEKQINATFVTLTMKDFEDLKIDTNHLNILKNNCQDGYALNVYTLPGNNLAVPSLYEKSHDNPLNMLHVKDNKCPLQMCKEKRSKLHSLMKKETPLCLHTLLTHCAQAKVTKEILSLKYFAHRIYIRST